jgi:hypothetical protein
MLMLMLVLMLFPPLKVYIPVRKKPPQNLRRLSWILDSLYTMPSAARVGSSIADVM